MTWIIIIGRTALFLFSSPLLRDSVTLRDSPGVTRLREHEALHITNINSDTSSLQCRATDVIVRDRKGRAK